MWGRGVIFQGAQHPEKIFNNYRASGGHIEGAWRIPTTSWEFDLRYDVYFRNENQPTEATFRTVTAGVQYYFSKVNRITFNYAFRNFGSHASGIDRELADVNGRLSLGMTVVF